MTTKVSRERLLTALRANLENHSQIVKEAVAGYLAKAREALAKRMDQLAKGTVVSLSFSLNPPQDHSEVYKTVIRMLEWNTSDMVELEADEFRQLVEDKWDWSGSFLHTNAVYSKKAFDQLQSSSQPD
jgi:hypothetical protein